MAYEGSAVTARPIPRAGVVRAADRATSSVPATAPIFRRIVVLPSAGSTARTPLVAVDIDTLQGYEVDNFDGLGFSLGKVVKNVGSTIKKAAKDTGKAVGKAAVQTAHVTGNVVTSKVGKLAIGGALALTGVGLPAAAAIGATTQGVGTLIKTGGSGKAAVKAAAVGAVGGAGASIVGKGIQKYAPNVTTSSRKAFNKVTPGDTFKTDATGSAINAKRKTAVIGALPKPAPTRPRPGLALPKVPDLVHGESADAPTALPVLMATAKVAQEGKAKRGGSADAGDDSGKKKGPGMSLIKRASSAVVRHAADIMPSSEPSYAPPPPAATPSDTPTPEKPQLAGIGGISPVVLLVGAGALAFVLMNRKRGR